MEISRKMAEDLGFPKPCYINVERERRWLCKSVPKDLVRSVEQITDLYIPDTRLRLREAIPLDGSPAQRRISRKVDADAQTRLITSIYLTDADYAVLVGALRGVKIMKIRHRLHSPDEIAMCVDEFHGALLGLVIFEAEFKDDEAMQAFQVPAFSDYEITDDERFSGYRLATHGSPLKLR